MRSKLADTILNLVHKEQLFKKEDKIIVAVSGGIDSTALLHLLAELELGLVLYVVYIDHQLRPTEVPAEIKHVKTEAERLGAGFIVKSIDTIGYQKTKGLSQEEAARNLRYKALRSLCLELNAHYIAVGHNSDDQVEEFFLRLLRGTGKCGLSGMALKQGNIIRPLLKTSKNELQNYLEQRDIDYCEDSSNSERIYTRNRVRLDLLPLLESFNSSIRKTILNTSVILQEEDQFLSELCDTEYQNCVLQKDNGEIELDINALSALHKAIQRRIIEKVCWSMENRPNFTLIESLLFLVDRSESGKTLTLEGGLRVTKSQEKLLFHYPFGRGVASRQKLNSNPDIISQINSTGKYAIDSLSHTLLLEHTAKEQFKEDPLLLAVDYKKLTFPLMIRYQREGEKFRPLKGVGSKKINRFLTDKKISREKRKNYPVLVDCKEEVIAILGLIIDDRVKIDHTTEQILTIQWKKD